MRIASDVSLRRPVLLFIVVLLTGVISSQLPLFLSGTAIAQEEEPKQEEEPRSDPKAIAIYGDAANFQNKKLFDIAVEEWQRLLKEYPDDPQAKKGQFYLGICQMQLKKYGLAAAAFDLVISKHKPFDLTEEAYFQLGWCRYTLARQSEGDEQKQLLAQSIQSFTDVVAKYAKGTYADDAVYYQGEAQYLGGDAPAAVGSYQSLIDNYPKSNLRENGMYALGVTYEELKQSDKAGEVYDLFLTEFPEARLVSEIQLRKADTVLRAGDFEGAEKMFATLVGSEGFPQVDYALFRQAACLASLNKHQEAAAVYSTLVKDHTESQFVVEARMSVGRCFYNAGKSSEALEWFGQVIEGKEAGASEAAHWSSRIHLDLKQYDRVLEITAAALATAGDSPFLAQLIVDRADALLETGEKQPALDAYLSVVEKHADSPVAPQALYNATFAQLNLKNYDAVIAQAGVFAANYAEHALLADTQYLMAEAQLQQDKLPEAEASFRVLVDKFTEHRERQQWQLRLGSLLYMQKKHEQTVSYLSGVLDSLDDGPQKAQAQFLVGSSYFFQDMLDQAAASLAASLAAAPKGNQADEALLYLARSQFKQKKFEPARQSLTKLLEEFSASRFKDQALYRLGECLDAEKMPVEAIKHYDMLLAQSADSAFLPYALYNKGYDLLGLGKLEDAGASFDLLVEKYPEHQLKKLAVVGQAEVAYQGGRSKLNDKEFAAAATVFEAVLKTFPEFSRNDAVLYDLAWSRLSGKQQDQATVAFARLTREFKESEFVADSFYRVGEDHYRQQRFAEALTSYAAALENKPVAGIREAVLHKTGWAHFKIDAFDKALESFQGQVTEFAEGAFVNDGRFMTSECLFKLKKYTEALAGYAELADVTFTNVQFVELVLLHGGQSAGQLKQWDQSLAMLNVILADHKDSTYISQAQLEAGRAHRGKQELDKANELFEVVAREARNASGAEARFLMGEICFGQKKHADAIRHYQRVIFGFGGERALDEVKQFQHLSATEAGICAEVLAGEAKTAADKQRYLKDAIGFYQHIVENHPKSASAANAGKRLEELNKGAGN